MLLEEYTWFHEAPEVFKGVKTPQTALEEEQKVLTVRHVAYGVVAPILLSVGIVGNVLVLVLLRLPRFKGVVFSYFIVLAGADLLSLVFCISPIHHVLTGASLYHSTTVWYSYFELLFVGVAMSFSVLVVVCITVHRFFSVCRPTHFKRISTPRFARLSIAVAFGVSVVSWVPMCFLREPRISEECESTSFTPPDNRTWWVACLVHDMEDKGYFVAYIWVRQALVSFLPILIVVSLNMLTLRGFMKHRRMRHDLFHRQVSAQASERSSGHVSTREERYLMGLLIAVMSSFVVTIIPSGIANAINISRSTSELNFVIFNAVANLLEILNHTLNFYLYILCSKPVRESLMEYYTKYSSELGRILRARFGRRENAKEERSRNSESPMSKAVQSRDSEKVFAISCTRLDSTGQVMEGNLGFEEYRMNEDLHDILFPHVIKGKNNGRDNPNFEFGL